MANIALEETPARRLVRTKSKVSIQWRKLILPLGIFVIALMPRILTLDAFITADEDDQIMFSHLFLKSVLEGDVAGALVLGYPGVPTLVLGGIGVGLRYAAHYSGLLPLAWAQADLMTTLTQVTPEFGRFKYPLDFLLWVRLPLALSAAASVVIIYYLTRRLLGKRIGVLFALVIAFDPFILAHTRVIHVDAPLAYFMFISFLAFVLYLSEGNKRWLILSGLFGGLAGLSKTPAVLLGPILAVSGLLYALLPSPGQSKSVRRKRLGLALVGWGAVAVAAIFALWPAMWSQPLSVVQSLVGNIQSVNSINHPTTGIFWGEQQSDQNPLYYAIVFPYHLTPLTTIGLLASVVMIAVGVGTRIRLLAGPIGQSYKWLLRQLPLAMGLVVYIVVFILPVSAISRRGDRYILPVFFAASLLAVLALWWLVTLIKQFLPQWLKRFRLGPTRLVGSAIFLQIFLILLYHPYYLSYYNPLMGGGSTAPYQLNVGWGEGLDQAANYLNNITAGAEKPLVASWYSAQFSPYYDGPTLDLSDQSSALTGEYTVFYINQVQRGFPSGEILEYFQQREPLHVVELGGIDYAWIYEGPVVSQEVPQDYAFPTEHIFGGGARLVGLDTKEFTFPADIYSHSMAADDTDNLGTAYTDARYGLPVTLYWETLAQINGEHNVYIRLVDDNGHIWGQVDRLILAGLWRPDRWRSGYFLRDEYRLPIDPATPPGTYHFEVGMYDFITGQSYGVAKNIGEVKLLPPENLPEIDTLDLEQKLWIAINDALTMIGHEFRDISATPGTEVGGKIFWEATDTIELDYKIQFSLLAPDRKQYVVAELPLSSMYPSSTWRRGEMVGTAYRFRIPALAPAGDYAFSGSIIDPQTSEPVGPAIHLSNFVVEAVERNFELPKNVTPVSAFIGDEIELVGYNLVDHTVAPEDTFGVTLYWRSLKPIDTNYTVFVHAVGPDKIMRGQWDSMPGQGTTPTSGWVPGEIIEDHFEVPMAKDAPAWKFDIFVGMYDAFTGERLILESQNAPISDNRVWVTRVQVVDP